MNDNNISINEDANTNQNIEDLLESILFLISNEKSKIQKFESGKVELMSTSYPEERLFL